MFLLKPGDMDWNGFKIQFLILFAEGRGGIDKLIALSLHQPELDLLDHYINPIRERERVKERGGMPLPPSDRIGNNCPSNIPRLVVIFPAGRWQ